MPSAIPTPDSNPEPAIDWGAISAYDYTLPPELIATVPLPQRDASRLLVVHRGERSIRHATFRELPTFLREGDLLIVNETRVVPAKLRGIRAATGGKWEGLFLGLEGNRLWRIIGHAGGKLQVGEELWLIPAERPSHPERLRVVLRERRDHGEWLVEPVLAGVCDEVHEENTIDENTIDSTDQASDDPWKLTQKLLDRFGTVPLPPYIERSTPSLEDRDRYQTTFAKSPGAIAAPTAGLHFTPEIMVTCQAKGIEIAPLTLHVGIGTFRPVSVQRLDDHVMHFEYGELPASTIEAIQRTRQRGGRVIAVGTTAVRTLETVACHGDLRPWSGKTNLFIRPPYQFQVVDALVTNFHLPKSTLLVLVSALAGRELILEAYRQAISERYRFFSYGDAMLII